MTDNLSFEVLRTSGAARRGRYTVNGRTVETPAFMPVATQASVKTLTTEEILELGAQQLVCNTYHLWQRPGPELVARHGGLRGLMALPDERPALLTDSGGFQVFSLSGRKGRGVALPHETDGEGAEDWGRLDGENQVPEAPVDDGGGAIVRRLDRRGVVFASPLDGKRYELTPERSVEVQHDLGTDIVMVLDECTPYPATPEEVERSLGLTHHWEERSLARHRQLNTERGTRRACFAIVQGGMYPELRARSAAFLTGLEADGYALGGLSVGEPKELYRRMLESSAPLLPPDRPRYVMGVGTPADLVHAVAHGVDLFDCVLPTRNARNGQLFTRAGRLNLRNARFKDDPNPPDPDCGCPVCARYSRAYLSHLIRAGEFLALRLVTYHNLFFYLELMRRLRNAVETDALDELARRVAEAYPV